MESLFETAAGSVAGRDHVHAGRNNQDALCILSGPDATVAVVCDGCSSGRFSEVGAQLGARLIADYLRYTLVAGSKPPWKLEEVRRDVLNVIAGLAVSMGGSLSQTVNDFFLFTAVVAVVGAERTFVAGIGDGMFAYNGEVVRLGPFPNNQPPYLAYAITGSSLASGMGSALKFMRYLDVPTDEVSSLLIGTDGTADLADAAERLLPGRTEPVGPLSQFWENDKFFRNPFILGRRLNLINPSQGVVRVKDGVVERAEGLLPDDTTLVAIRRRKEA